LRAKDFASEAPGRLVRQTGPSGEFLAYLPDPLPREMNLGMVTVGLLSKADQALGELKGVGQMLPNPDLDPRQNNLPYFVKLIRCLACAGLAQ